MPYNPGAMLITPGDCLKNGASPWLHSIELSAYRGEPCPFLIAIFAHL